MYAMKYRDIETMIQRCFELQTAISTVVLIHFSHDVLLCCRIVVWKYFHKEEDP
ncbi:MAG: hypothetical protein Q8861_00405 [Bacteroidota bacterium]|nr:hypothetical protein [Bacteroidota bacterium]MDP4268530.1 hypothetical protein [Bacteroidota bacterium]